MNCIIYAPPPVFQSTSSIQRKTENIPNSILYISYFNPLPLYRGRLRQPALNPQIYIFQSTSSIQRKTRKGVIKVEEKFISIHFLYTEEDAVEDKSVKATEVFQSTSYIQRKTQYIEKEMNLFIFQSTSSLQRKIRLKGL